MSSFHMDITAFAEKTKSRLDESCRAIKISLFSGCIRDTRVDTGRLRGNWQTSTGGSKTSAIGRLDPSGSAAMAEVQANVTPFGVDYLTNNLPYAPVWNQRDGIIARNMARIDRIVREVAR